MIHFKAAALDDAATFLALMREYYAYDAHEFLEEKARQALEPLLANAVYGLAWLILDAKLVIGYAVITFGYSLEFGGRDAFLDELYLEAGYRGRGLGQQAIHFAEEQCRDEGVRALHLEVARNNAKAQIFYGKSNFASRAHYFLMSKRLEKSYERV